MHRQGKGMDLFHSGVTLVMSDIEGLTAVQEMLPERSLTSSLALHNSTLRSLLPKYCGYEVCCSRQSPTSGVIVFHVYSLFIGRPAFSLCCTRASNL